MKQTTYIDHIGTITYEESAMSGNKTLTINGYNCPKVGKKDYTYVAQNGTVVSVKIKGNFMTGVKLIDAVGKHEIVAKPKWYELAIVILSLMVPIVWGNSVELCKILPLLGGAVGGALGGVFGVLALFAMKKFKTPAVKVILGLGTVALGIIVNYVLCIAILAALI